METPSPARLYATLVGALLVVLGIVGFFYSASFDARAEYGEAFGAVEVNAWINLFYLATGSLGVLVAGVASRTYALAVGLVYTAVGIVGWGSEWLFLTLGVLGLAAALGTPKRGGVRPSSKPRAKPARERA